ncbi:MAG: threonine/serine exporter family protein [Lapillicoccus sp.]
MPDAVPPRRRARTRSGRVAAGNALRRRTSAVVRASDPPTDPIPVWTQPDGVDVTTGRAVVELAVRAGIAFMATGAAASDVVASVLRITAAYGLRSLHVDVTFSALTVSYNRGPNADPLTMTRVVRARNQDFTRLARLHDVVDEVAAEPVPVADARERFDSVIRAPHPYRRWVTTLATGAMGAGTSLLAGGGWVIVLTSIVSAAVIFRVLTAMGRRGVPGFFAQAIGAAVPTVFAIGLAVVQNATDALEGVLPSLVVASGIVVLLAGLSLVGAAQDAIEGFYVTAGARVFQVFVLTLGIVVGIVVVLGVAARLGVVLAISPESEILAGPVLQVVAAAIIAAGWAISTYTSIWSTLLTALAGAAGWAVNLVVTDSGTSAAIAAALAASVIGFVTQLAQGRFRFSAIAVTTAAIVPLLPGRAVYRGLFEIVSGSNESGLYQGLGTLLGAVGIGMGLAAGVSLGTYAARVAIQAVERVGRLLDRPSA